MKFLAVRHPRACYWALVLLAPLTGRAATLSAALGQAAYDRHDIADAQRIWQAAAATGDARAAFDLGLLYDGGTGVAPNAARALAYYRMAAQAGLPEAEFNVAILYDAGKGAPRDASTAALWYARAAVHGFPRARYNLAQLYDAGDGVPRNPDQAAQWYDAAAAAGLPAGRHRAPPAAPLNLAAKPAPAVPMPATVVAPPNTPPKAELVWLSPKQPGKVRFVVTVERVGFGGSETSLDATTSLSAAVIDLPPGAGNYRWRVYTVAVGAAHYATSPWAEFTTQRTS